MDPATLKTAETAIGIAGRAWRYRMIFSICSVARQERLRCEELLDATSECLIVFGNMDKETRDFRAPLGIGSTGTGSRILRQYLNNLERTYREFKWSRDILRSFPLLDVWITGTPAPKASQEVELRVLENQIDGPINGMMCLANLPVHQQTLGWIMRRGMFNDITRKLTVADARRNLPPVSP
jgi:hypothetical protein